MVVDLRKAEIFERKVAQPMNRLVRLNLRIPNLFE